MYTLHAKAGDLDHVACGQGDLTLCGIAIAELPLTARALYNAPELLATKLPICPHCRERLQSQATSKNHADSHAQPKPQPGGQSVTDAVVADLQYRREQGKTKYGQELLTNNGRDALVDAYQEALDLVMYLKQELLERDAGG